MQAVQAAPLPPHRMCASLLDLGRQLVPRCVAQATSTSAGARPCLAAMRCSVSSCGAGSGLAVLHVGLGNHTRPAAAQARRPPLQLPPACISAGTSAPRRKKEEVWGEPRGL